MVWFYNGEVFDQPSDEHYGFVYRITNLQNNKAYIGKNYFGLKRQKY